MSYYNAEVQAPERVINECFEITNIGNSAGVILPDEILERLRVKRGDTLYAVETKNGIELTAKDPAVAQQMEIAERVMQEIMRRYGS